MERQVSILLPTGEVEVTKDRSVDMVGMNTSWDKPVVNPNKIPAVRKGSLEVIKARKQLKKKSDHAMDKPPSLVPVVSATVDSEVQTDFNISILHQGNYPSLSICIYNVSSWKLTQSILLFNNKFSK